MAYHLFWHQAIFWTNVGLLLIESEEQISVIFFLNAKCTSFHMSK